MEELDRRDFLAASGAALLAASLGVSAAAPSRRVLITADLESHVVVADPGTGRVLARVGTREGPRAIETVAGGALVCHTTEGVVSLMGRSSVRRVLRGFSHPRYGVSHGRRAYVTDSATGEVVVIDLERGRVVRRVAVGDGVRHLGIRPDGRSLWVALGNRAAAIAVLSLADPDRPRTVRRLRAPFLAHDVVFSPSGRRVWVTSGTERRIAILGGARPVVLAADAAPQHVTFARGRAFVAAGDSGTVRVHDLRDGRLLRTAAVPVGSFNVTRGAGVVATPSLSGGTLALLDHRGRVTRRTRVARAAHDACIL